MLALIQKYFYPLLLAIIALLGVALANLAAASLGIYLRPSTDADTQLAGREIAPPETPSLKDFEVIRQRNIFDSTARYADEPARRLEPRAEKKTPPVRGDIKLVGTVTAGESSLALLTIGRGEIESYRLGEALSDGGVIDEISRYQIAIRNPDGTLEIVPLYAEQGAVQPSAAAEKTDSPDAGSEADGIRTIGENRYVIDRRAAENARGNMPQLLRQARLEPNIVGGRTEGFQIKMIRPDSLLAKLGMRKGDVLVEVNGLELDSPEKGLQVFQQLREAKNIVVGLTRNGEPMSLTYEVN